jgi:hypothetical protein
MFIEQCLMPFSLPMIGQPPPRPLQVSALVVEQRSMPYGRHFGPLRTSVVAGSNHLNHVVLAWAPHSYLRWRNACLAWPVGG